MAHLTIKTIEERLAMMKRADNMWAEKYVLDVGHLLKERTALLAERTQVRRDAFDEAASVARNVIIKHCMSAPTTIPTPHEVGDKIASAILAARDNHKGE